MLFRNFLKRAKGRNLIAVLALLVILSGCAQGPSATPAVTATPATTQAGTAAASETATPAPLGWSDANVTAPGEFPIVKEGILLTVAIQSNPTVKDWNTNEQTLYIEEKTGIDLEFDEIPNAEFLTKVDLMVAAGGNDLPDILIGGMPTSSIVKWGQTGTVIPLNEYYDSLNYFIKQSFDEGCSATYEEAMKYMTCYDGNIYGLPSYSESYNNELSGNRLLVYQPWLDKLGIDRYSIVTTEDYYDVLVQMRDGDLNENGQKDEIPLIACKATLPNLRRGLMSPFVTCQPQYWTNENGKIDVVFDRPEWREGIQYIRRLVEDGLLMPESFTQDDKQMTALQSQDPDVVGGVARVSTTNLPSTDRRYGEYTHIMPLQGPSGMREIVRNPSAPSAALAISSNCASPEAAFRLGDYLCSEEMTIWGRFGVKGEDWFDPQPGELSAYEELGLENYKTVITYKPRAWADVANIFWANTGPRIYGAKLFFGQAQAEDTTREASVYNLTLAKDYFEAGKFVNDSKIVSGMTYNEEESEIMASIYKPVTTYVEECWARFILGDLDINSDADWNSYLSELSKMDIDKAIAATQSCVDRMNEQ